MQRYQAKISGPILDRIDLRIEVGVPPAEKVVVMGGAADEPDDPDDVDHLRQRIAAARARQMQRYARFDGVHCNAQMTPELRRTLLRPRHEAVDFLRQAMTKWNLSVRASRSAMVRATARARS